MYANNERKRIQYLTAYQDLKDLANRKLGTQVYQKTLYNGIAGEGVKFDIRIGELMSVITYINKRYYTLLER